jgi:hypothetical protein
MVTWERNMADGLTFSRDNLVDNFSKHKEEVEKLLAEGVKKL